MLDTIFKFHSIGDLEVLIQGVRHVIPVELSSHGARMSLKHVVALETPTGTIEKSKQIYFGEGRWLTLPNIEDMVLEILGGTEEEVEELSQKYDDLIAASLPELITGNLVNGFIKQEVERLNEESDLRS